MVKEAYCPRGSGSMATGSYLIYFKITHPSHQNRRLINQRPLKKNTRNPLGVAL